MPPPDFLLSVVMPIYNERKTLLAIVAAVRAVPIRKELVLVDDGSKDGSRELLDEIAAQFPDVRVVKHERNQGKGAALKTGFQHARGDFVVIQDADLEYDPNDYPLLLQPLLSGEADVVYGSRFLIDPLEPDRPRDHFHHYLGNRVLTFFSNLFTGLNLTDMETCYKCMRRSVLDGIVIKSCRFTVEPELTAKLAKSKARIFEVPIHYRGRSYGEGKKIGWRDGVAALWAIVRYRFAD
ncbi:MAG: glycosyltransferase family 2 protein [Planctomycetota bacterium]|jgi:glycosyltransferase involved in cell wall biosynthesis|nr:glycosyltransferase family 2 protein [Planctomycetota bacterium]MSR39770.1 glycosyltransferase family 2 protein [Planctomycetota bacterium]